MAALLERNELQTPSLAGMKGRIHQMGKRIEGELWSFPITAVMNTAVEGACLYLSRFCVGKRSISVHGCMRLCRCEFSNARIVRAQLLRSLPAAEGLAWWQH